jgi:glutathione peroxidase
MNENQHSISKRLSPKQALMQKLYPALIFITKLFGKNSKVLSNTSGVRPVKSIYDLDVTLNNGNRISLSQLKGKKILLVNTASDCGYTGQYAELQKLHEQCGDKVTIIGFPANDFKEQEKGSDAEIAAFCQVNFGVQFPLAKKSVVIDGVAQHPVFQWLTHKDQNGWNNKQPSWNFSKFLVSENGVLTHYFDPSVSPMEEVKKAIEDKV